MDKSPQELEYEFYAKKYYLSYSALNKLLYSPMHFYRHYVLGQKEEKPEDYLVEGKIIHALMLGPEIFGEQFIVSPGNLPGDSIKQVVDKVLKWIKEDPNFKLEELYLTDFDEKILSILKEINLYQAYVDDKKSGETGDEKRLKKVITAETISYFDFMKSKGNKILIDQQTLDKCLEGSSALLSNSEVYHLLGLDSEMRNIIVRNEYTVQSDMGDIFPFGFKGIIDNLVIDNDTKTLYINDLKTTGKTIAEFKETVEFYKYWIQAAIYSVLAKTICKDDMDEDWKIIFTFIVYDKYGQVYCFEVTPDTLMKWEIEMFKKVEEFRYHYENKSYTLPHEFLSKKVVL